ncbi:MAG: hypothetical protein M1819_003976 [Sarea resinae]|nr:MAG: hypothetical protein M1819_003976 [Sarea resinae]
MIPLPRGKAKKIPTVQHIFANESSTAFVEREVRRAAVKRAFHHSWEGYKKHAWLSDEIGPLTGTSKNPFCGWAATAVDSLDTLWIMGMKEEFEDTIKALGTIDFTTTESGSISVFETGIRILGGFLGAYDVSGGIYPALLVKAVEVGDMLYAAFDTPNRMPVSHWDLQARARGDFLQVASRSTSLADFASLTLEFTRLSQLMENPKYFDAVQRITNELERSQNKTRLPGMWPAVFDASALAFDSGNAFSVGALSDSAYEYFPKQYMMLGGRSQQYRKMYEKSFRVFEDHIFYRPMTPDNSDILFSGNALVSSEGDVALDPEAQHLTCFAGGMVGIGAKIFDRLEDMDTARKLVDGCIWAYSITPTGIMPESFRVMKCQDPKHCVWNEEKWLSTKYGEHLPRGFTSMGDSRYILRPEAIESVFVYYRLTGDTSYQDKAWQMFEAIERYTRTDIAYSSIKDVTVPEPEKMDEMSSFWTAETLKYFYLIFSEPDLISLDDFVLLVPLHFVMNMSDHGDAETLKLTLLGDPCKV